MENEFKIKRYTEVEPVAEIPESFPLVCAIGHIASGKDETMAILQRNFGMEFVSASQPIVAFAQIHGIDPRTREDWWSIVQEMRSLYGKDILGRMAYDKVNTVYKSRNDTGNLTANGFSMNGFRLLEDVNYLKENSHMFFIGIEAHKDLRYRRLLSRNRMGDVFDRKKFEEREAEEGEGIELILKNVDVMVQNEGSFEELEKNIITIIKNRYPHFA